MPCFFPYFFCPFLGPNIPQLLNLPVPALVYSPAPRRVRRLFLCITVTSSGAVTTYGSKAKWPNWSKISQLPSISKFCVSSFCFSFWIMLGSMFQSDCFDHPMVNHAARKALHLGIRLFHHEDLSKPFAEFQRDAGSLNPPVAQQKLSKKSTILIPKKMKKKLIQGSTLRKKKYIITT